MGEGWITPDGTHRLYLDFMLMNDLPLLRGLYLCWRLKTKIGAAKSALQDKDISSCAMSLTSYDLIIIKNSPCLRKYNAISVINICKTINDKCKVKIKYNSIVQVNIQMIFLIYF